MVRHDKKTPSRLEKKAAPRAQKRAAGSDPSISRKSDLLEEAITQMNAGKYGRSSGVLKELLTLEPNHQEAKRLFATLQLRIGSLVTARTAFESMIQEAMERQDYWLAESLLREYLAAGPRCVRFLDLLGQVLEIKGDPDSAVHEYAKAIEILIDDPDPERSNYTEILYDKITSIDAHCPAAFRCQALMARVNEAATAPPSAQEPPTSAESAVSSGSLTSREESHSVEIPKAETSAEQARAGGPPRLPWEDEGQELTLHIPAAEPPAPVLAAPAAAPDHPAPDNPPPGLPWSGAEVSSVREMPAATVESPATPLSIDAPAVQTSPAFAEEMKADLPAVAASPVEPRLPVEPWPEPLLKIEPAAILSISDVLGTGSVAPELSAPSKPVASSMLPPSSVDAPSVTNHPSISTSDCLTLGDVAESPSPTVDWGLGAVEGENPSNEKPSIPAPMPWEQVEEEALAVQPVSDGSRLPVEEVNDRLIASILEQAELKEQPAKEVDTKVGATTSMAPPLSVPSDVDQATGIPEPEPATIRALMDSAVLREERDETGAAPPPSTATPPSSSPEPVLSTNVSEPVLSVPQDMVAAVATASPPTVGAPPPVPPALSPAPPQSEPVPSLKLAESGITDQPEQDVVSDYDSDRPGAPPADPTPPNSVEAPTLQEEPTPVLALSTADATVSPLEELPSVQPSPVAPVAQEQQPVTSVTAAAPVVEPPIPTQAHTVESEPQVEPKKGFSLFPAVLRLVGRTHDPPSAPVAEPTAESAQESLAEPAVEAGLTPIAPPSEAGPPLELAPEVATTPMPEAEAVVEPIAIATPPDPTPASAASVVPQAVEQPMATSRHEPIAKASVSEPSPIQIPTPHTISLVNEQPGPEFTIPSRQAAHTDEDDLPLEEQAEEPRAAEPIVAEAPVEVRPLLPQPLVADSSGKKRKDKRRKKSRAAAESKPASPAPAPPATPREMTPVAEVLPSSAGAALAGPVVTAAPAVPTVAPSVEATPVSVPKPAPVRIPEPLVVPEEISRPAAAEKPRSSFKIGAMFRRMWWNLTSFVQTCFNTAHAITVTIISLIVVTIGVSVLVVGGLGVAWLAMEEKPNKAFQDLTGAVPQSSGDAKRSGYAFFLGLAAPEQKDAQQAGGEMMAAPASAQAMEACYEAPASRANAGTPAAATLASWYAEASPAAVFGTKASVIREWTKDMPNVLDRYRQWTGMSFEDGGHGQMTVPDCPRVLYVHRIFVADGFTQGMDAGLDRVELDLGVWRNVLRKARTLGVKMLAVAAINDDARVLSGLVLSPDLDPKYLGRITKATAPLDSVELSMRWTMQNQFLLQRKSLEQALNSEGGGDRAWYLAGLAAMPMPRQRILNDYAEYYESLIKVAETSRETFTAPPLYLHVHAPAQSSLDYVSNPLNNLLEIDTGPAWETPVGQVRQTDALLRLVSLQAYIRKTVQESTGDIKARIAKAGQHFYDPFTGLPMLVQVSKGRLYSVGANAKDDDADPDQDVSVALPSLTGVPAGTPKK